MQLLDQAIALTLQMFLMQLKTLIVVLELIIWM